uniref:Uncharacterized protein n=1 Tax=Ovis aries TaxID=9940 RepID=A0AC11DQA0_SHEEP
MGSCPEEGELGVCGGEGCCSAAWSSGVLAPGAPCVTTPGTWRTPRSCASSWGAAGLWTPWRGPPSDQARGPCGWMRWGAGAVRPCCGAAQRSHGATETAGTRRTRACAVQGFTRSTNTRGPSVGHHAGHASPLWAPPCRACAAQPRLRGSQGTLPAITAIIVRGHCLALSSVGWWLGCYLGSCGAGGFTTEGWSQELSAVGILGAVGC